MKVIKPGRKQKGWAKEFKCTGKGNADGGGCGATLLVEQGDLFQTSRGYYDGSTDYYITFQCCECGVLTDIPSNHSPLSVRELPSKSEWDKSRANKNA